MESNKNDGIRTIRVFAIIGPISSHPSLNPLLFLLVEFTCIRMFQYDFSIPALTSVVFLKVLKSLLFLESLLEAEKTGRECYHALFVCSLYLKCGVS